jgi:hypothetical protein
VAHDRPRRGGPRWPRGADLHPAAARRRRRLARRQPAEPRRRRGREPLRQHGAAHRRAGSHPGERPRRAGSRFADGAREVLTSGRDASLQRAERVAKRDGNRDAAEALHETRSNVGALTASELPVKNYEGLSTPDAIAAIRKLTAVEDVRTVIAFEEAHKARSSVVSAAQTRIAAIAKQVAGV